MAEVDHYKNKILNCPRCRIELSVVRQKEAEIDNCDRCHGTFFDQGEMFAALGASGDPSFWDRPETGKGVRQGNITCPRCNAEMLLQDIAHEEIAVEIDRCPKCMGIWLDGGETDKIMTIGRRMAGVAFDERQAARDELAKMGEVDFSPPGLLYRFFSLFSSLSSK